MLLVIQRGLCSSHRITLVHILTTTKNENEEVPYFLSSASLATARATHPRQENWNESKNRVGMGILRAGFAKHTHRRIEAYTRELRENAF